MSYGETMYEGGHILTGCCPNNLTIFMAGWHGIFFDTGAPGLVFPTVYLWGSSAPSRCSPRLRSGPGVSPTDKPGKDSDLPPAISENAAPPCGLMPKRLAIALLRTPEDLGNSPQKNDIATQSPRGCLMIAANARAN